jgi:hypothetical protein
MNKQEILKIFSIFNVCYPKFIESGKEEVMVEVWYQMLKEYQYDYVMLSSQNHIKKSKFAPTIHDIIEGITDLQNIGRIDAMTAWGIVTKAIRYYGYYRQLDALNSMPQDVAKIVESMGWQNLCMSENEIADRAHFTKAYDTMQKREQQLALMGDQLTKLIGR